MSRSARLVARASVRRTALAGALATGFAAPATAADAPVEYAEGEVPASVEYRDIVFDLGIGGRIQPTFEGSSKYEVLPYPIFGLRFLRLPYFGEVVTGRDTAFSIYPSINFIGARNEDDAAYLRGLDEVDFSFELGPGVSFRTGPFRAFAEMRYGITGHNGFVGEGGIDYIFHPLDRLRISFGPRASVASTEYMDAYFGVSPAEAARSTLPAFDPDAGIKDVGLGSLWEYTYNEKVRFYMEGTYSRFVGDAADSPVIEAGADNQFTLGIGVTYRFGADLY